MTDEEKVKTIHEILDLVLRINGGAKVSKGKGHPTAFFNYSGHINAVDVHIHKKGWTTEDPRLDMYWIHLDNPYEKYNGMNLYDTMNMLRAIAEETEAKYEVCDKEN